MKLKKKKKKKNLSTKLLLLQNDEDALATFLHQPTIWYKDLGVIKPCIIRWYAYSDIFNVYKRHVAIETGVKPTEGTIFLTLFQRDKEILMFKVKKKLMKIVSKLSANFWNYNSQDSYKNQLLSRSRL